MKQKEFLKLKKGDRVVYSAFGKVEHGTVLQRDKNNTCFVYVEWDERPKDNNKSYCDRQFVEKL